jgi:hypothetical protein
MATESTMEKVSAPKKRGREFPHIFRNTLSQIPNLSLCPSSPDIREPISVVIPLDQLGQKKRAMMQKSNVSHGKGKMDKMDKMER